MKLSARLCGAFLAIGLSGCTELPGYYRPSGGASPNTNAPCASGFLNSQGPLSWINGSVGKPGGLRQPVASLERPGQVSIGDLLALGLPGAGAGIPVSISCYTTAHFQDGTTQNGILSITDPGAGRPLQVTWIDRAVVEEARVIYAADVERRRRESIAYSDKLQFCTFEWKVAVEAKALMSSGWTERAIADHLVARYAYGPSGQVYRGSGTAEAMIRHLTAVVSMSRGAREAKELPDYASQQFLDQCSRQSARPA